jgi:hypothetical protein
MSFEGLVQLCISYLNIWCETGVQHWLDKALAIQDEIDLYYGRDYGTS